MSSEIYELMKRSDEVEVVEKAHRRPRFVEDCVREMIAGVVGRFPELDGASFVSARQENLETIHQHNVRRRAPRPARASCARRSSRQLAPATRRCASGSTPPAARLRLAVERSALAALGRLLCSRRRSPKK